MHFQKKSRGGPDLGSVVLCVFSPTRIVLVKDKSFPEPFWKLPGGSIESTDTGIISAAIRECREETGIQLTMGEVFLHSLWWERRGKTAYRPSFCIVRVSEEKLDTRLKVGDEDGHALMVAAFDKEEVPIMVDLLEQHRPLVNEAFST